MEISLKERQFLIREISDKYKEIFSKNPTFPSTPKNLVYIELEEGIEKKIQTYLNECFNRPCEYKLACEAERKSGKKDKLHYCKLENRKSPREQFNVSARLLSELLWEKSKKSNFSQGLINALYLYIGKEREPIYIVPANIVHNKITSNYTNKTILLIITNLVTFIVVLVIYFLFSRRIENHQAIKNFETYYNYAERKDWNKAFNFSTDNWRKSKGIITEKDFIQEYRMTVTHNFYSYKLIAKSSNYIKFEVVFSFTDNFPQLHSKNDFKKFKLDSPPFLDSFMIELREDFKIVLSDNFIIPFDSTKKNKEIESTIANLSIEEIINRDDIIDYVGLKLELEPIIHEITSQSPSDRYIQKTKFRKFEVEMIKENGIWKIDKTRRLIDPS